jgi:glucose-6-phosphate isomerase
VPRLVVVDDVDPWQFAGMLERLDLKRTFFHVISRSGETAETLAQFLVARDRLLREVGAVEYLRHVLITTEGGAGPLRQIVNDEGFACTDFPTGVLGHDCVLSPIHLVGAAALGADIEELLGGARAMDERCRSSDVVANPAAELAATYYALATLHGVQASVLFPYSSRLAGFGTWWQALWAHYLGQQAERETSRVSVGLTPVVALGASEREAHLQLCLEGPADKVVTLVRLADHGAHIEVPEAYGDLAEVAYLGKRDFAELLDADQWATEYALARRGRPSVVIELPTLSAHTVGQLVRLIEMSVLLTALLFGVDPHARPATEELRGLRGALLGKSGLEAARGDIEQWQAARERGGG